MAISKASKVQKKLKKLCRTCKKLNKQPKEIHFFSPSEWHKQDGQCIACKRESTKEQKRNKWTGRSPYQNAYKDFRINPEKDAANE